MSYDYRYFFYESAVANRSSRVRTAEKLTFRLQHLAPAAAQDNEVGRSSDY